MHPAENVELQRNIHQHQHQSQHHCQAATLSMALVLVRLSFVSALFQMKEPNANNKTKYTGLQNGNK